ncbi:tyrosine-type recombinase/integrase [Oceanicaulis sp. HTCC2633]|uniref:tyrosine-type recombinase/integrase n=1 Tax=Oceanicaulis sp. HTCC2633 TaxID=314254 RepID=UPI000325486D|nr:tyrosine-type recombinase/integrase [Oceanicaulis sp. HTCC2633]
MTSINLKYVSSFKDRHGKRRWRFRRKGYRTRYLPGLPGSEEFMAAYAQALANTPLETDLAKSTARKGTIDRLIEDYYHSSAFDTLETSTQRTYRSSLEPFRNTYGHMPVRTVQTRHLERILFDLREKPTAANKLLKRLKTIFDLAVRQEIRHDNPAKPIKARKVDSDGFHAWTEAEIEAFKTAYPSGSKPRLALALLLCTGQRGSDVARMGPQDIVDIQGGSRAIRVKQQKTKTPLLIPILPELAVELAARNGKHMVFLTTEYGKAFSVKGFQQWFAERAKAATGNPKCTAHGLRKACAYRLAEAGATVHMIQSITGHKTLAEVARYTAGRDQFKLASAAQALLMKSDETGT